jgi:hypothetical protein
MILLIPYLCSEAATSELASSLDELEIEDVGQAQGYKRCVRQNAPRLNCLATRLGEV